LPNPLIFQARLLKQIENDKLERTARAGKLPSQTSAAPNQASSAVAGGTQSPRVAGAARLCFRLPDGSTLKEQFDAQQTYDISFLFSLMLVLHVDVIVSVRFLHLIL
jgi:hypothetical protein